MLPWSFLLLSHAVYYVVDRWILVVRKWKAVEWLDLPLILNTPSRVDWKACSATKEEETSAAETMRQSFQPFNFTDDGDD